MCAHGMHGCVCLCVCTCVRVVVDAAFCVPRGLRTQSEPSPWPDLCKFFVFGTTFASPVGSGASLFPVMLEVTALLPSSSVPSVSFLVSFSVVSKAALGLSCTPHAQIPDNLCVGACFLVFIHEVPFPRTLVTKEFGFESHEV